MRRLVCGITAGLLLLVPALAGQKPKPHPSSAALIARGKYLVEDVGLCGDCHTPRDDKGEFIQGQWLKGAPIDFKLTVPMPVWADKSPNIAGLPGWEKDAAIKFLMTGIAYNGLPGRPPMPQFRFNVQDAQAIVAYLKSLAPAKSAKP
ncbi:MAG TPA: c-type cytochrome [Terriglobales bacterium]|nr:c-type cytochrome [Terriglobales bacterium]